MTAVSPSTCLESYYLLYSSIAASKWRLPASCSSPCPWPCSRASSFALALTLRWVGYEQVQPSEPAKIITFFSSPGFNFCWLSSLSCLTIWSYKSTKWHKRGQDHKVRGGREEGRFDDSPSWATVGWHSPYPDGGWFLLEITSQESNSILYSLLHTGTQILPLDKYIPNPV